MELINTLIDRLQAAFPPNRVMLVLAGPITAASIWLSAWITTHVPGVELPVGVIAGAIGAVALITITLLYKWFDQWQHHENISISADLDKELLTSVDSPEAQAFFVALGTFHGLGEALEALRKKVDSGGLSFPELEQELGHFSDVIAGFIADHPVEIPPPAPVASPAAEATLPVAPQPAE